jgi:hypothetical protein
MEMNRKQIALSVVLMVLLAIDAAATYSYGYLGFFRAALATAPTITLFADMVVALTLICIWMGEDARERGFNALPYMLMTLALGSPGALLYLIRRFADQPEPVSMVANPAR